MEIREVILCKFGEVVLKGANRQTFESQLLKELRRRATPHGIFKIYFSQSTVYVEPQDEFCDMDGMYETAKKVFGIAGVNRAAVCEKNMDSIKEIALRYLPEKLYGKRTFKVDAKRSDKRFPLKSPEISAEIGGVILSTVKGIKVDVHNPEVTLHVEIRKDGCYLYNTDIKALGGYPVGALGKGMLMLSGGIDSPVAGYLAMKRGIKIECIYFESPPHTSLAAKNKVISLVRKLNKSYKYIYTFLA